VLIGVSQKNERPAGGFKVVSTGKLDKLDLRVKSITSISWHVGTPRIKSCLAPVRTILKGVNTQDRLFADSFVIEGRANPFWFN
jgi:hypothetical protein